MIQTRLCSAAAALLLLVACDSPHKSSRADEVRDAGDDRGVDAEEQIDEDSTDGATAGDSTLEPGDLDGSAADAPSRADTGTVPDAAVDANDPGSLQDATQDGGDASLEHAIVTQVGGGIGFSCAMTAAGGIKCWGDGSLASLGDGKTASRTSTPVDVAGIVGAKKLIVAASTACAIKSDDQIACWGGGASGFASPVPAPLHGLSGTVIDAALGPNGNGLTGHGCVVDTQSNIRCWGDNSSFQLGATTPAKSDTLLSVPGLTGYKAVAAGNGFSCGLTTGGAVRCWGTRALGQLGDGMGGAQALATEVPTQVLGLTSGVKQIVANLGTACALTSEGGVKCWGSPAYGAVGATADLRPYAGIVSTPVDVLGLTSGVAKLGAGERFFCALMEADGSMRCWGYNQNGQLGDQPKNITINQYAPTPVSVVGIRGIVAIGAGASQTCAAPATGGVLCWGSGAASGSSMSTNQIVPSFVKGI